MAKSKRRERDERSSKADKKGSGWADSQTEEKGSFSVLNIPEQCKIYKMKKGKNKIDVIEHKVKKFNNVFDKGELAHSLVYFTHPNMSPTGKPLVCPKTKSKDEPCPICEYQFKLFRENGMNKEAGQIAAPFRNKKRIAQVIRDRSDMEAGLQIFDHAFEKGYGAALKDRLDGDKEEHRYRNWSDAKKGKAVEFIGKEESFGTEGKWLTTSSIDLVDRKPLDPKLVKEAPSLDALLDPILSYKELDTILAAAKKGKKGGKKKDEDEDLEDDEDEDEDDSDLEDDDSDLEDEDDDEDEDSEGDGDEGDEEDDESDEEGDDDEDDDDEDDDEDDEDDDDSDDDDEDDDEDDGDDDDDDGEEDDEDDEEEDESLSKGDRVKFKYKGKKKEGKIVKIVKKGKKTLIHVKGDDGKTAILDEDDETLEKIEEKKSSKKDKKEDKKPKRGSKASDDDDDEDEDDDDSDLDDDDDEDLEDDDDSDDDEDEDDDE